MAGRVKTAELAKMLGISRQRVNELSRKGKLTRSADGKWDPDRARSELKRTLDDRQERQSKVERAFPPREPDPGGLPMTESTHEVFNRARAAREIAMAKERQLALRKLQGELLEAAEVESAWTQTLTSFKNRLLSLPDKLAPKMAACSSILECRAMIDQEVRKVLIALSETKAKAS